MRYFHGLLAASMVGLSLPILAAPVDVEDPVHRTPSARGALPVTVGPDPDCDFTTITAGIVGQVDGGEVRVMTGTYTAQVSILSRGVDLIGGFPDCSSTTPTGRSTIDRGGAGLGMDIYYPAGVGDPVRTVNIENWVIRGGGGSGFSSGGVNVEGRPGRLLVNFRNVQISDNARTGANENGAGLRIITTGDRDGTGALATLDNDSAVLNNTAAGDGGGIHCRTTHQVGTATLLRLGTTLVLGNEAVNGGGVALDACRNVFLYAGGPIVLIFPTGGIIGNNASGDGGGLYLENGAVATLSALEFSGFGDAEEAALLSGNSAAGSGGGAHVIGTDSSLSLVDAYVISNSADLFGGGVRANSGGVIEIERPLNSGACEAPVSGGGVLSRPPCSVFEGNDALGGGAFSARGESRLTVSRTVVRNNTTGPSGGAAANIANSSLYTGAPTEFRMEGSVVHDNDGGFLFKVETNADAEILFSTIADNPVALARLSSFPGQTADLAIRSSLVDSNSWFIKAGDGTNTASVDCVIGSRPQADLNADNVFAYFEGMVPFRDRPGRDYRLTDRSAAIDYCDDVFPPLFPDIDGNDRGLAWTGPGSIPDPTSFGDFDLGAYEAQFSPRSADLGVEIVDPDLFVDAGQTSVGYTLRVTNNGPETAFGEISVFDDVTVGAVTNRSWSCSPDPGVSCSPSSGTGDVTTDISDMQPGEVVLISVNQDLVDTSVDAVFQYVAALVPSGFNLDLNGSNDLDEIEVRIGVFADGFEASPVLP
ncbi:hypothetical protein HFP89_08500 [Wenzhouxiangella sp. XN79A]|uniref:hypothetical protein n=1 Tax=Wenzhouxiangella sp. XN79A TaxID=2724193 RepID=UPI00144ABE8A|nr:hypothetical protein [Wenzhouxiangella sp. XN79A]NKI35205.1 hypothetical protein [Wenzhouxiangella sp. XN79A]